MITYWKPNLKIFYYAFWYSGRTMRRMLKFINESRFHKILKRVSGNENAKRVNYINIHLRRRSIAAARKISFGRISILISSVSKIAQSSFFTILILARPAIGHTIFVCKTQITGPFQFIFRKSIFHESIHYVARISRQDFRRGTKVFHLNSYHLSGSSIQNSYRRCISRTSERTRTDRPDAAGHIPRRPFIQRPTFMAVGLSNVYTFFHLAERPPREW